jgi:ribonuclease BN (tRNA processing enzyme)
MFEVLMTGVGDAFSTRHWGTHFLLRKDDYILAIDCPDSYRRALRTSGFQHGTEPLDAHHIDAMVLTHLHGDHVNGLEMLACYLRFAHERRLPLYTSPDTAVDLWPRLRPSLKVLWDGTTFHEQSLESFLDVTEVAWNTTFEVGPFQITARPTMHHLPAMAMRITDGNATLGYSCDTAFDEELIEWLSDADLIIHESSLGAAQTPLHKLMGLPEELRQKMLVVHYPDEMIGADLDELELATEGTSYPVDVRRGAR